MIHREIRLAHNKQKNKKKKRISELFREARIIITKDILENLPKIEMKYLYVEFSTFFSLESLCFITTLHYFDCHYQYKKCDILGAKTNGFCIKTKNILSEFTPNLDKVIREHLKSINNI